MPVTKPSILYMDDDHDDVDLLQEAINTLDPAFQLLVATDGEEGLEQLRSMKEAGMLPRLIVLDINMPRIDGRMAFLKIKEDSVLSSIPIVVFSTSSSALDRLFFLRSNVEYITKPIRFDLFVAVAKKLLTYVDE